MFQRFQPERETGAVSGLQVLCSMAWKNDHSNSETEHDWQSIQRIKFFSLDISKAPGLLLIHLDDVILKMLLSGEEPDQHV